MKRISRTAATVPCEDRPRSCCRSLARGDSPSAVDGQNLGFSDAREVVSDERVLYRGEGDVGLGRLRVDADVTLVRDVPPSPVIRVGTALNTLTPINANFNPADAKINQDQYHLAVGYSLPTAWGAWDWLVSFAYSDITDIRAFLHPDLSGAADTQRQRRYIDDGYLDSHLAFKLPGESSLIVGADLLYGHGQQTTLNGNDGYTVPLDGSVLPPPTSACRSTKSVPLTIGAYSRGSTHSSIGNRTIAGT